VRRDDLLPGVQQPNVAEQQAANNDHKSGDFYPGD
jgi:hypothetical protein